MQQFYITFQKAFAGLAPRAAGVSFRYTFMQQLGRNFFLRIWAEPSNSMLLDFRKQ